MFRVSYSDTPEGQRWCLHGRLTIPWVEDLRSHWQSIRERAPLAHAVVDLKEVTFIDQAGERLLGEMKRSGAELIAAGVANRYLIETLENPTSQSTSEMAPERGEK